MEKRPSPAGRFSDGRHLGCCGTHSPSREGAGGDPSRGDAKARFGGEILRKWVHAGWIRRVPLATPVNVIAGPRHEVSEPIGLGRSPCHAQARRGELAMMARAIGDSAPDPCNLGFTCAERRGEPFPWIARWAKARNAISGRVPSVRRSCLRDVSIAEVDERRVAPCARER